MSPRTVVLTFDNLGASAEIESGSLPEGTPEDDHPSLRALPALLDLLEELHLPGTFFVEARNCEVHPETVRSIAARGFEVAHHAWRHERWGELDPAAEERVLARGVAAFAGIDVPVRGFRPPGGATSPATPRLLREQGLDWCSPEGERVGPLSEEVTSVPFRWPLVDALYAYPPFAGLREDAGLPSAALSAPETAERLWRAVHAEPDPIAATLILHPFLMVGKDEPGAHHGLLRRLAAARDAGALRVVDGSTLVDEVRAGGAGRA